jgi:hypothetical protein
VINQIRFLRLDQFEDQNKFVHVDLIMVQLWTFLLSKGSQLSFFSTTPLCCCLTALKALMWNIIILATQRKNAVLLDLFVFHWKLDLS